MNEEIRTRIAPSPTGPLHIGTAHTALFNFLFARQKNGKFIVRIEDTDKERSEEEYFTDIAEGLLWLGLNWDEGPERDSPYGPYRQSKRLEIYRENVLKLIESKKAYYCYCTPAELKKERDEQMIKKQAPRYSGRCRNLTEARIAQYKKEGRQPSIRFKIEPEKIKFKDLVKGEVEFDTALFGDFIIMKSDGSPVFLFAGVVDDFLMKISHVIRGEDHLSNTPRQMMLAKALNFSIPEYGHLPLILNPDRSKLSKRKNPTSIQSDFRAQGYLPEAMINFLALMGWTSKTGRDFWTLEELTTEFDISQVGSSPSIFDQKKLDFLNGYYIRKLSLGELAKKSDDFLKDGELIKDKQKFLTALSLVQERLKKLSEVPEQIDFFYQEPGYYQKILIAKGSTKDKTKKALEESCHYLQEEKDFCRDSLEQLLRAVAKKNNLSAAEVLWPIRVALTGKEASPGTFEVLEVLGKETSIRRIKKAINMLQ